MECTKIIIKSFLKFNLKASPLILGKEAFKRYVRKMIKIMVKDVKIFKWDLKNSCKGFAFSCKLVGDRRNEVINI